MKRLELLQRRLIICGGDNEGLVGAQKGLSLCPFPRIPPSQPRSSRGKKQVHILDTSVSRMSRTPLSTARLSAPHRALGSRLSQQHPKCV